MELLHASTNSWKKDRSAVKENIDNLVIQHHHLIRKHHIQFPNSLSSKKIYHFLIYQKGETTSLRLYYQNKFNDSNLHWSNIYLLVRIDTKDSELRAVQFKLIKNGLYLNKMFL